MNTQTKAERLAEALDIMATNEDMGRKPDPSDKRRKAAAELRRLHQSEREGWRYADELEQERKRLHAANQELLNALHLIRDSSDGAAVAIAKAAITKHSKEQA